MRTLITYAIVMMVLVTTAGATSTGESVAKLENSPKQRLNSLLTFQTDGPSGVQRLVPEIFLGFEIELVEYNKTKTNSNSFALRLRFGPTVTTSSITADSTQELRALMLPGNLSFDGVLRLIAPAGGPGGFDYIATLGFGVKAIATSADSLTSILQHNISLGAAVHLKDHLLMGLNYTWGWHNLTNESESAFSKIYDQDTTKIAYLTVTLASRLPGDGNFIYASWSRFRDADKFSQENQDKSLVLGLQKTLGLNGATNQLVGRPKQ